MSRWPVSDQASNDFNRCRAASAHEEPYTPAPCEAYNAIERNRAQSGAIERIRDLIPEQEALITPDYYAPKNLSARAAVQPQSSVAKAVLEGDPANNIALEPGDVVTIFSKFSKDDLTVPVTRRSRLVRLEGEVNHAGVWMSTRHSPAKQCVSSSPGSADWR